MEKLKRTRLMKTVENDMAPKSSYETGGYIVTVAIGTPIAA
jgi:hypothetical protein